MLELCNLIGDFNRVAGGSTSVAEPDRRVMIGPEGHRGFRG
jgi:hypothetical protein